MKIKPGRSQINLIIDIVLLLLLAAMSFIGFLLKFSLLPGSEKREVYGNGVELYLCGMDRHEWGRIHLIISIIFIVLIVLHIVLHWKMIVCIFRKMLPPKYLQYLFGLVLFLIVLFSFLIPLILEPEVQTFPGGKHENGYQHSEVHSGDREEESVAETTEHDTGMLKEHREDHTDMEIFGYMSIREVAENYEIDESVILEHFGIPLDLANEKLGRLRRNYDFTLSEMKDFITTKLPE